MADVKKQYILKFNTSSQTSKSYGVRVSTSLPLPYLFKTSLLSSKSKIYSFSFANHNQTKLYNIIFGSSRQPSYIFEFKPKLILHKKYVFSLSNYSKSKEYILRFNTHQDWLFKKSNYIITLPSRSRHSAEIEDGLKDGIITAKLFETSISNFVGANIIRELEIAAISNFNSQKQNVFIDADLNKTYNTNLIIDNDAEIFQFENMTRIDEKDMFSIDQYSSQTRINDNKELDIDLNICSNRLFLSNSEIDETAQYSVIREFDMDNDVNKILTRIVKDTYVLNDEQKIMNILRINIGADIANQYQAVRNYIVEIAMEKMRLFEIYAIRTELLKTQLFNRVNNTFETLLDLVSSIDIHDNISEADMLNTSMFDTNKLLKSNLESDFDFAVRQMIKDILIQEPQKYERLMEYISHIENREEVQRVEKDLKIESTEIYEFIIDQEKEAVNFDINQAACEKTLDIHLQKHNYAETVKIVDTDMQKIDMFDIRQEFIADMFNIAISIKNKIEDTFIDNIQQQFDILNKLVLTDVAQIETGDINREFISDIDNLKMLEVIKEVLTDYKDRLYEFELYGKHTDLLKISIADIKREYRSLYDKMESSNILLENDSIVYDIYNSIIKIKESDVSMDFGWHFNDIINEYDSSMIDEKTANKERTNETDIIEDSIAINKENTNETDVIANQTFEYSERNHEATIVDDSNTGIKAKDYSTAVIDIVDGSTNMIEEGLVIELNNFKREKIIPTVIINKPGQPIKPKPKEDEKIWLIMGKPNFYSMWPWRKTR